MSKWLTTNPPTPLPWGNDPKQSKSEFLQVLLEDGTETLGFFGLTDSDRKWVVKEHWFTIDSENPAHTVVGWHWIPKWVKCSECTPSQLAKVMVIDQHEDTYMALYRGLDAQGNHVWIHDISEAELETEVIAWLHGVPEYEP